MDTLIKNARVLTMDDSFTEFDRADILIRGTKIVEIGLDLPVDPNAGEVKVIDAAGKLVMPGLVNGHIHSPGNFSKENPGRSASGDFHAL